MEVRKVTAFPAKPTVGCMVVEKARKRKVAGYARVSTDQDEQQNSYEVQMEYYTGYIQSRADWEFAGMYSDEGISGTQTKKRDGFNQMIEDALAGKIDLILTKSVSRFARNTVDSLTTIRKLKDHNVEVYFEKENIFTFDGKGELLLTIMSSMAQEESRSISENTKWGNRKKFQSGRYSIAYGTFLGYDKGPNGTLVVNREQAKIVKLIFQLFLDGLNVNDIKRELVRRKIKAPMGGSKWHVSTITSILTNEKYKGDALLQKTYVSDFLTHEIVENEGQVPQYYIENDHEAIISPEVFDRVQVELLHWTKDRRRRNPDDPFSGMIQCKECGGWFGAKTWHSTSWYARSVYRCNRKYSGEKPCPSPKLEVEEIKNAMVETVNWIISHKKDFFHWADYKRTELMDERSLQQKKEALIDEMQKEDRERNYTTIQKDLDEINVALLEKQVTFRELTKFSAKIRSMEQIAEFDEQFWKEHIDRLLVDRYGKITVRFKCKYEVTI